MRRLLATLATTLLAAHLCLAVHRHWTVSDGLPTGEVWQIVELPTGQMLVNCEGVFCISNGAGFDLLPCDYDRTCPLRIYAKGYGRLWQGDSLLWLHDFYRLYLFDARRRAFRYDADSMPHDSTLSLFLRGEVLRDVPDARQWRCIDSLGLSGNYGTVVQDRQGGLWIGTRTDGIYYVPPRPPAMRELTSGDWMIGVARSYTDPQGRVWRCRTNGVEMEDEGTFTLYNKSNIEGLPYDNTTFICQLLDGRYLLCDSLATLGYFLPEAGEFVNISDKVTALRTFRRFVGACPINRRWTAVYAQNGLILLDTQADTIAVPAAAGAIWRYATKYNCMLLDRDGLLWVGTQNGLFCMEANALVDGRRPAQMPQRIVGLANNCIRSLVLDQRGNVWAGTSSGISRITPSVLNLSADDGVPTQAMMERAACATKDGWLVFAMSANRALTVHPDSLLLDSEPRPVVITGCWEGPEREHSLLQELPRLSLAHDLNYLTLQFSTLDYATPSHTNYRYRLLPLQEQWHTCDAQQGMGTAAYTTLPHGSYRFEAEASLAAGGWGDAACVEILILPPWWLTWWAKLLYVLLGAAGIAALLRWYLVRRRRQLERDNEARVNHLFELRQEARHQFAQSANVEPDKIATNSAEEQLVTKMLEAIGQNMDNCDYTVEQLAGDVGMSRANLYKKMQQLLGITPNDFLRNVRLKHAAQLLAETAEPVNQISLMVGFQTSRYFSHCFRQMFGVTPTEYRTGARAAASPTDPDPAHG